METLSPFFCFYIMDYIILTCGFYMGWMLLSPLDV